MRLLKLKHNSTIMLSNFIDTICKRRLSFEKISKIFQMSVTAQDVHSTDQRAKVLKVVTAELIKAKFQFQTIKKT